jgi:glutamyl-tRNA synthetase
VSILINDSVPVTLVGGEGVPETTEIKQVACHKKNEDLGTKPLYYSKDLFIEQEDARTFKQDEEVLFLKKTRC